VSSRVLCISDLLVPDFLQFLSPFAFFLNVRFFTIPDYKPEKKELTYYFLPFAHLLIL
jgi:hypothetical protein